MYYDHRTQCRRHLFHESVRRFRRCQFRRPTWIEMRELWRATAAIDS